MANTYTAVMKQDNGWWIGWIEEVPEVNCQERTRETLLNSLRATLDEALEFNRQEAIRAAAPDYTEELVKPAQCWPGKFLLHGPESHIFRPKQHSNILQNVGMFPDGKNVRDRGKSARATQSTKTDKERISSAGFFLRDDKRSIQSYNEDRLIQVKFGCGHRPPWRILIQKRCL
jgi:predicted RNase H-like HicB family nuclease